MLIAGVIIAYMLIAGAVAAISEKTTDKPHGFIDAVVGLLWPVVLIVFLITLPVLITWGIATLMRKAVGR